MTPDQKILEAHIRTAKAGDRQCLDYLARLVSHNLTSFACVSQRFEFLKSFCSISREVEDVDEYTGAYFTALCNVATACIWEIEDKMRRENDLKFVRAKKGKFEIIMKALAGRSKSHDELSLELVGPQLSTEELGGCLAVLMRHGMVIRYGDHPYHLAREPFSEEILEKQNWVEFLEKQIAQTR